MEPVDAVAEAQTRFERVMIDAFRAHPREDHKAEAVAFDILNRNPKEVRFVVLESLRMFIAGLGIPAQRAVIRNVARRLIAQHPLENIAASVAVFLEIIEAEVFTDDSPRHKADEIVGQALRLPSDLLEPIRMHLPAIIAAQTVAWKAQAFRDALVRLEEFHAAQQFLEAAQNQSATPEEQARAQLEGLLLQIHQASALEAYQARSQFFELAMRAIQNASLEVVNAMPRVLLEAMKRGQYEDATIRLLYANFERLTEIDSQVEAALLEFIAWSDTFYLWERDAALRMRWVKWLESLETMPALLQATLRRTGLSTYLQAEMKPLVKRISFGLNAGEAWSDAALHELSLMPPLERAAWLAFLEHANTEKAKPSTDWDAKTKSLIAPLPDFEARAIDWLSRVGRERTHSLFQNNEKFDPWNANIVRGLAWSLALVEPADAVARALAGLVETSLKKVPGVGPRNPKLATAGTVALGRIDTNFAVGQLARLKARVTFKTTLNEIEKALDESAKRAGITQDDLEELVVPSFRLQGNGTRTEQLGSYRAELRLEGNDVTLAFFDANDKKLKASPASLKTDFADDLKDLKTAQKDIAGMVTATKVRLEKLFRSQKTWSLVDWQERYLENPVVAHIAKRLIWRIGEVSVAIHPERGLEGISSERFNFADSATVSLWHPIDVSPAEVLAWRAWLEGAGIQQPWKQAHREIYRLTAAEERTRTYSNRFAAHIIKQHQFNQLAALRGWKNPLRLSVDDRYPPATLELPAWNLRAEYWVEGIGEEYGADTTDSGTYLRLITDQLRFYALDAAQNRAHASGGGYGSSHRFPISAEPIPLTAIPALVFSEVMRDVDLFVGVASVGNDPTWNDGGPGGRYREYWQSYSFGDLSETAQSRRAILEVVIPRLKIRDVASINGKFLHVKGSLREYKIHLGSGNILMLPNDEYLCIVPNASLRSEDSAAFLPFEGDGTLAVILSKAFLLADDAKIKDQTITRQLKA